MNSPVGAVSIPTQLLERDLTPGDFEVLEFERTTRWRHQGLREGVISERFGISRTRYIQRVLALIDHPQAAAYDPATVRRLLDRRDRFKTKRSQEALRLEEPR